VGGGLGMTHGNTETFPRLADVIGFIPPERVRDVATGVVTMHRDFGDRTNRRHARLKYVLEDRGAVWFRQELERRLGFPLAESRPWHFAHQGDLFGWHPQHDGRCFLGLYVETGRVRDRDGYRLKSALREVVQRHRPELRLTPSQNLLLVNVAPGERDAITRVLSGHGVAVETQANPLRRASMACPALPTCGLALAESERFLPDLLTRLEGLLAEVGLKNEEIVIRMTGCPNGCVRPYTAELGFVGRAPGKYNICVGGNEASTRLNRSFRDGVKEGEIVNELRPLLTRFAKERNPGERFGDWCARVVWQDARAPR
jgi:sulfite reductase (NADPH) hemoprotein beta-component